MLKNIARIILLLITPLLLFSISEAFPNFSNLATFIKTTFTQELCLKVLGSFGKSIIILPFLRLAIYKLNGQIFYLFVGAKDFYPQIVNFCLLQAAVSIHYFGIPQKIDYFASNIGISLAALVLKQIFFNKKARIRRNKKGYCGWCDAPYDSMMLDCPNCANKYDV